MSQQNDFQQEQPIESSTRLRDLLDKYLIHWKLFLVGIAVSIACAYYFVRYATPLYEIKASVLIKDDEKGNILSEFSAFEDLDMVQGHSNIDNEIEILKSRRLMADVARELDLNLQYILEDGPVEKEVYIKKPVNINFINGDSAAYKRSGELILTVKSATEFSLENKERKPIGTYKFGRKFDSPLGPILITPTDATPGFRNRPFTVRLLDMKIVVEHYRTKVQIIPINEKANVIEISLVDPCREKGIEIVNTLIKKYNADAINDKNQVAMNTANFINERIDYVTNELSDVEGEAEDFKTKNQLVDVMSEAGLFLSDGSENHKKIVETSTQLKLVEYMSDYMSSQRSTTDLVPTNIGIEDASIVEMTETYNKLVLERNRLLKSSSDKNPVIVNLDEQLYSLNRSLKASLNNQKVSLSMKERSLLKQDDLISSKIASVPKYEREYRVIQRQQQIKESLYLYLLQKREETAISLAVTVANAKIIDDAYTNDSVVSPKKRMVYGIAVLVGIVLIVSLLYLRELMNTKVQGKKDLDRLNIPYLGDVPKVDSKDQMIVRPNDNSPVSEAFRLIRTNLSFMMGASQTSKLLFITSTVSKEGKSFLTLNLAATYALADKKVLVIGTDLRAPKLQEYASLKANYGVTNFITNPNLTLEDLVVDFPGYRNLHIVTSGPIPPNPAELLASHRMKELFDAARAEYDVVIVDTAPIGLVADTLLLTDYADLFIYVVRNKYLDKRMLQIPEKLYREKRLPKMALLLNSVDQKSDLGYGYGYGYGYGVEAHKPWWKKILRRK